MDRVEKAAYQSADAPFTFVLSTDDVDRMGDVVVQEGISLAQFRKNPIALFAHSSRNIVGTWENIRREGNKLLADLKLAKAGTSRLVDELRSLVEQRILRAASVGLGIAKSEPMDKEHPYGAQRYTKTELLEASLVAVPANPFALAMRGLSDESRALFFVVERGITPQTPSAIPAAHAARPNATATGGRSVDKKSIADKIKEAQARLAEIDARGTELKALAEGDDGLTEAQAQEVDALSGERETVAKNIANLENLEKLIAKRALPAVASRAPGVPMGGHGRTEEKGMLFARAALAHVLAYTERRSVLEVVKDRFQHDDRVAALVKTAVGVADTTTAGWAKELVAADVQGFVDALIPFSIYGALFSKSLVIDFGDNGSVSVPYRSGGNTDLAGAFVGENGVIPVKRTTLAAATLNRYKMAVISTVTKELSRSSTPQAETLIRRLMLDDTGVALDRALISAAPAVAGTRPAGLLNGVAALPASAAATTIDKMLADLSALLNALAASGNGSRPVFIVNPAQRLALSSVYNGGEWMFRDEVAAGRLMGVELISSLNVPVGDVILCDAANLATALGGPEFDASETATLVMANADGIAPTQATLAGDRTAIGTAEEVPPDGGLSVRDPAQQAAGKVGEGSVAISMFQQWGIALRTVLPVSWQKIRPGSVQWVDNVTW